MNLSWSLMLYGTFSGDSNHMYLLSTLLQALMKNLARTFLRTFMVS